MALRTFEHFPKGKDCPICGTDDDGECFLAGIDGTQEGNNEEAIAIHTRCLDLRFSQKAWIIYQAPHDRRVK